MVVVVASFSVTFGNLPPIQRIRINIRFRFFQKLLVIFKNYFLMRDSTTVIDRVGRVQTPIVLQVSGIFESAVVVIS